MGSQHGADNIFCFQPRCSVEKPGKMPHLRLLSTPSLRMSDGAELIEHLLNGQLGGSSGYQDFRDASCVTEPLDARLRSPECLPLRIRSRS